MSEHEVQYYSAEELAKKWDDNQVALPKIPFFLINLYQFIMPLFVVLFFIAGILYLYSIFQVSIWVQILLAPGIFMVSVYLLIWSMSKFCRILNTYYDKKSPPKEGLYSREFDKRNVVDPAVHYYHLRGFMYKWPVWVSKKSIFPWMVNYVLRDMAGNKIHKNAYYGDSYVCLEFSELSDGVVIENGAVISSHVVDSIFGNLTVKKVFMKKNAVLNSTAVMAPGTNIDENCAVGPRSFVPKNWQISGEKSEFIYGVPSKYFDYRNFLDLLPESFQTQWEEKKKEWINSEKSIK
ncbi:MAG: hypothetical protein K9W44_15690 [Candidatus Lokiarchaeota archaeon]|nr:hypothetical protein [Candidatus Harpocratesius repetitus]